MLRFLPNGWLEWLLRPFLLADSAARLYVEIHAPDWRFLILALLLLAAWLGHRFRPFLLPHQSAVLLGLTVCFYVWTAVSGNGRYFMWGLLLVGPLIVVAARALPATRAMRNATILLALIVQGTAVSMTYMPNTWGLRPWREGPGLALEPSTVREAPAVFLTMSPISYSALVPQMHPASRWSNISGQRRIEAGELEYPALQRLLGSPLPKYLVIAASRLSMGPDDQPIPEAMKSVHLTLGRAGFALDAPRCTLVRTAESANARSRGLPNAINDGFWFCPVRLQGFGAVAEAAPTIAPEVEAVFAQIERRCPRFFPPGGRSMRSEGAVTRYYSYSDTALFVDDSGEVYFKNAGAINPTTIATADAIRRGAFVLDCHHLPGRYQPPWSRD